MSGTSARPLVVSKMRSIPVFKNIDERQLDALSHVLAYREYPKGAFLAIADGLRGDLYILVSGCAKVSLASAEGKELALRYLEAPAYFSQPGASSSQSSPADVIATTDVELLVVKESDLEYVFSVVPGLATVVIRTLSEDLDDLIARLEAMTFHDATHRVMRVLLNIATATYESKGVPVVEGFTHYDIAALAGTSRETASRVVSSLAREGIVATKGRKIVVDLLALGKRVGKG